MEQEPEFGDPGAPATKADVRTAMRFVLAEIRHLRTWTEGRFAVIEERFKRLEDGSEGRFKTMEERFNTIDERFNTIDERFNTVDEKIERSAQRVIATMTWRMLLGDLAVVAAVLGVSAR